MDIRIDQKNMSAYAYNKIKQFILEDVLKSGEKIIQEKMAQKLGMSKIPIIQALSILQKERLVEYHPRKGFFVRSISKGEFSDLLDVRGALEGLAVKKISENLNDSIKKQLLNFLNEFEVNFKENNITEYFKMDKKFHYYLIEALGNYYLTHINNSFNILLLCYIKGFKTDINVSMDYHRKIINAIINREHEEAAKLMSEHLENVKDYF